MKKAVALILALLLTVAVLVLPAVAVTAPRNTRVATIQAEIEKSIGSDTPGAAVVLIENGEIVMREGFGYADIASRDLVTPETVFEIGDLSGLLVALAAYRLAQEDKLSLTDDIATYIPESFLRQLELSYPVTVEQLLLGCAGFEGRTFDLIFDKASHRFDSLEKALLAEVPEQIAEPGSFYSHSPFGIALAAYVVECVAGRAYADYTTENILEPLGMNRTLLDPTEETALESMASGHTVAGEGAFAVAARDGRSYAGLYPASGALSTAADLSALLTFLLTGEASASILSEASRRQLLETYFESGIFTVSAPGLSVRGGALGRDTRTLYFGASLWMDPAAGVGALVLTNTASGPLLTLPSLLCGATLGIETEEEGDLPELETFEGVYMTAASERRSFVGRMARKNANAIVEVTDGGALSFLGMTLVQVAPGVFADATTPEQGAVVQFLLDDEGEVSTVVTAWGETYFPAAFFERELPATILFILLLILAIWFAAAGIFALMRFLADRGDPRAEGFVFVLPRLFAALISFCVLLQIFVGVQYGGAAFSSFFAAMALITLFLSIGAIGGFLLAFMASLTRRGMTSRVARNAMMLVAYILLISFWRLSLL